MRGPANGVYLLTPFRVREPVAYCARSVSAWTSAALHLRGTTVGPPRPTDESHGAAYARVFFEEVRPSPPSTDARPAPGDWPMTRRRIARALPAAWWALVASLMTSCVRYHSVPLSAAESFRAVEARRLDDPAIARFARAAGLDEAWPPVAWDVQHLTVAALYFSPALDVARAQWDAALGAAITAGARPNPALTVGDGYNATTSRREVTPWIPQVSLAIPLDVAGKRRVRLARARAFAESARLTVVTEAWQVRRRVREAALALYVARASDSLLAQRATLHAAIVRILEAQQSVGDVSAFAVTQARLAQADGRLAALDAAQQQARARSALADAIGVSTAALASAPLDRASLERVRIALPAAALRREALVNRSDIQGALAEYTAAQEALQLEVRTQYPDLSLGPGYQLDQTDVKWTLALTLPVALLNRNRGPIAEATARRAESAARVTSVQTRVLAELDGAIAVAGSALAQVAVADSLLEGVQRQERSARASVQAGEIGRLELLGLELELVNLSLARLAAVASAQRAAGALEDALQSPLDMTRWSLAVPERLRAPTHPKEEK